MPSGNITANDAAVIEDGYLTIIKQGNANARLHLSGTFDGATVQVVFQADGNTSIGTSGWLAIDGGAYTDVGDDVINLPNQTTLNLVVTNAGAGTDIDWNLV